MAVEAPLRTQIVAAGLTCEHCVMSVTEEISEVAGVGAVEVGLNDSPAGSTVTISSERRLDRDEIAAAVAAAGYTLVD
ncbi:MAG: heavy-metal-associated domain-containing protein [Pseudonocardia sp.]|nr:heavy-metal-associated domain-containing protein [Pseudonocardia sp.]